MVNIRVIHSLTLLQESWKLLLETQKDYHVLTYKNNYRDLPPTHEDVDIILMDLPNFLRYSEETPSFSPSTQTKLAVFIQAGEEHYITKALQAGAHGFLMEEMEEEEFLWAIDCIAKGKYYIHGRASHHLVTSYKPTQEELRYSTNPLTKRAFQTLQLVAQGLNNEEVAQKMGISTKTAKNHMANVLITLNVQNRTGAVMKAIQNGWMEVPRSPIK